MTRIVTITARLSRNSAFSYRLHTGLREEDVPKSLVTDNHDGTWQMPEWLAKKKGFVRETTFEQLVRENEGRN